MKKAWLLAFSLFGVSSFGQGLIYISNFSTELPIPSDEADNYVIVLQKDANIIGEGKLIPGTGFLAMGDPVAVPGVEAGERTTLRFAYWPKECCGAFSGYMGGSLAFVSEPLGGTNSSGSVFEIPRLPDQSAPTGVAGIAFLPYNYTFATYPKPEANWTNPGQSDRLSGIGSLGAFAFRTEGSVEYVKGLWTDADVGGSVHLVGGATPGKLQNTFYSSPTPSFSFVLSFKMSGKPDVGNGEPPLKKLRLKTYWSEQLYTYDTAAKKNTPADMKWEEHQFVFKALGAVEGAMYLEFINESGDTNSGPVIDSVRVDHYLVGETALFRSADDAAVLSFRTCPKIEYQVQSRLPGAEWENFGGVIIGDGYPKMVNVPIVTSEGSRTFRVKFIVPSYVRTN